jgi:nitroreductase
MEEIFRRKSVRDFTDEKVEDEKIEKLLRAAMSAPTAANQREWEFIVVTDRELLDKLAVASPYSQPVGKSAVTIVLLGNFKKMVFPHCWEQDLGACAENILLEAVHLGLGGVWLGVAPEENRMNNVETIFSLPEDVRPFAMIALGYAKEDVRPKDRFEPKKVHYNEYKA